LRDAGTVTSAVNWKLVYDFFRFRTFLLLRAPELFFPLSLLRSRLRISRLYSRSPRPRVEPGVSRRLFLNVPACHREVVVIIRFFYRALVFFNPLATTSLRLSSDFGGESFTLYSPSVQLGTAFVAPASFNLLWGETLSFLNCGLLRSRSFF